LLGPFVQGKAPALEVDVTDYGYRYVGIRPLEEGETYVRAYHYVMPFTQIRPQQFRYRGREQPRAAGHFWVPMDDENCMVWNWMYSWGDAPFTDEERLERASGNGPDHVDPRTFRSKVNRRNGWLIDRQVQKTETFTGIEGINAQDRGVQESMGPIVDRSKEYLGPADRAIIVTRRLLLQAVKTVGEGGDPPGVDTSYYQARAVERILPKGVQWREALLPEMYPGAEPVAIAH
jgi:phthalate 4,5-dioxygenase